jgi:hypothetical protein
LVIGYGTLTPRLRSTARASSATSYRTPADACLAGPPRAPTADDTRPAARFTRLGQERPRPASRPTSSPRRRRR